MSESLKKEAVGNFKKMKHSENLHTNKLTSILLKTTNTTRKHRNKCVLTDRPKTSCMGMPTLRVLLQELRNSTPKKYAAKIYIIQHVDKFKNNAPKVYIIKQGDRLYIKMIMY